MIKNKLFQSAFVGSVVFAMALASAPVNALVLSTGQSVSYGFDFTSLADMSGPGRGLTIIQRYSADDILSGTDNILLEIMASLDGSTLISTNTTVSKFGPTDAWGFGMVSSIVAVAPIYASYKGALRITAVSGSVNLSEVSTTLRDSAFNDLTIVNMSAVPEPAALWTILAGLGVLTVSGRVKRKRLG